MGCGVSFGNGNGMVWADIVSFWLDVACFIGGLADTLLAVTVLLVRNNLTCMLNQCFSTAGLAK
jgi:hypothetical protein